MDIRNVREGTMSGIIRIPSKDTMDSLYRELYKVLKEDGFNFFFDKQTKTGFSIRDIRINPEIRGYNISNRPYSNIRRVRYLSWDDWVEFDNTINDIFDKFNLSGNIKTLSGHFIIRKGFKRYTEQDWNKHKYENIGSRMFPMERCNVYVSEE